MLLCLFFYLCIFCISGDLCAMQENRYHITIVHGEAITELIPFIAQQRLAIFKEYPYLYQGSLEGEYTYLTWFASLPHSAVAVAYDGENIVAFLTGTSFADFAHHFQGSLELFENAGLDPAIYYYLSEAIVLPEYRNKSVCRYLTHALEQHARARGFSAGCLTCEQHEHHPLKPAGYKELGPLFAKLGYHKTELTVFFTWDTIQSDGSIKAASHPLTYWVKNF